MLGIRKIQGFSLLELLVVLSIGVILILVSFPTFKNLIQVYRLRGTVENLYYNLQYARSEAVKRNTTVYVNFSTGDSWCYGINPGSTCNCTIANNCTLGAFSAPNSGVLSLSLTGIAGNTLQFEGTHGASNTAGIMLYTLYGQSTSMGIKLTIMGNTTVCSSYISGYSACS